MQKQLLSIYVEQMHKTYYNNCWIDSKTRSPIPRQRGISCLPQCALFVQKRQLRKHSAFYYATGTLVYQLWIPKDKLLVLFLDVIWILPCTTGLVMHLSKVT